MNPLFTNYTSCCRGNHETQKIGPNSTVDKIRRYMLGEHNERTLKSFKGMPTTQLAIPYETQTCNPIGILRIDPRKLPQMNYHLIDIKNQHYLKSEFYITLPNNFDEIVICHNALPVDTMSRAELMEYIHNESRTRKPRTTNRFDFWKTAT